MRDYYCNQKFDWLKIDAEKKTIYSCCDASPVPIDFEWLKKNPGMLFNVEEFQKDRIKMLKNERVKSCENSCWKAEDKNLWSRRLEHKGNLKTNLNIISKPKTLDITLSGECNLTCTYCCKEFSSAWRNDIINNGDYSNTISDNRYKLASYDKTLARLSQKKRNNLLSFEIIRQEIKNIVDGLEKVIISGGEPFLDGNLVKIINELEKVPNITVFTGLGYSKSRLKNIIEKIGKKDNLFLKISAESTKINYEFNRFGNKWKNFLDSIEFLKDNKIKFSFANTYSNLTILDYINFYELFQKEEKNFTVVYNPDFMNVWNLDYDTKTSLIDQIHNSKISNIPQSHYLIKLLTQESSEIDRKNLEYFVKEFCKRRNIKPDFMPNSLKKWLNLL
jgi:organic radical activating enzyme